MEVRNSKEVQRMAKCEFCDKGVTFGIQVSHSHRRSNRPWKPNVKRVKAIVDGSPRHVYVCTRCMRSGKVTRAVCLYKQNPGLRSGISFYPVHRKADIQKNESGLPRSHF